MRYNIVKLNAKKILDYATITENTNPTNKNKEFDVQFKLDGEMFKSAISITEPIDDNAAFYQLRRIVKEEKEGIVSDDNILIDKILYLDFSGVSFDIVNESNNMIKRENLKKNIKLNETQKSYYLFLNGFTVIYSEKKNVDYKAFDKSGSMSRASIISFISIQFFEGMEESAKLGMDLDSVILSKYLAYRGLMFSGGQRIIQCESFLLNEKTVIVVEEKIINKKCTSAITASKNYSSTFNIDKLENCDIEIKMFDGEGLVSFEYAREIVRQLYKNEIDSIKKKIHHYLGTNLGEEFFKILETAAYPKKSLTQVDLINALPKLADKAGSSDKFVSLEDQTTKELLMSYMIFFNKMPTSFQIRLPFVKGMLHVVEFRSYLKNLSVVKIEDYYKIDRALGQHRTKKM